jgi:hypothetical protein
MKWLQDPNQRNLDNLIIVRCETSKYFRNKEKEYLKARIDVLETKLNKKYQETCWGICDFKKGY